MEDACSVSLPFPPPPHVRQDARPHGGCLCLPQQGQAGRHNQTALGGVCRLRQGPTGTAGAAHCVGALLGRCVCVVEGGSFKRSLQVCLWWGWGGQLMRSRTSWQLYVWLRVSKTCTHTHTHAHARALTHTHTRVRQALEKMSGFPGPPPFLGSEALRRSGTKEPFFLRSARTCCYERSGVVAGGGCAPPAPPPRPTATICTLL